jgi:RHS repeat-associated protein
MLRSSTTSYYHADGLGSVTSLSNGSGALAQTYTFDSFGKQTASSGSLVSSFQYTGRESDPETGLYYYRARYYDPTAGRFMSEDPIGFNAGTAFYRYVNNNSTNLVDPSGLLQVCCRPANLGNAINVWAVLNLVPPPCHCFLKSGNSGTLGGYHQSSRNSLFGDLVLRPNDRSDDPQFGPNSNRMDCTTVPGKTCENDANARNAFNSLPKTLGGYGFSDSAAGTSNDAAKLILQKAGLDSTLPACAWGKNSGTPPTAIPRAIAAGFPKPRPPI